MAGKIEGLGLAAVDASFRIAVQTIKLSRHDKRERQQGSVEGKEK